MKQETALAPRNAEILRSIVQAYIETGEPVASRTVSKVNRTALSAASIRNIMADLEDDGYLSQPHTSAGRVPTAKAFRHYVQSLQGTRMLVGELARIRSELSQFDTLDARIERSSHVLTELTRNVGIVAAIPADNQTLSQIELVSLGEHRILIVVVTQDRTVHNKTVLLPETVSQDELNSIRNYINYNFSGWKLIDVRNELRARLEQESALYNQMLKKLIWLYDKGLLDVTLTPSVHMEGASNLVGLDFHLTRERMRELFRTFEEKKRVLQILDQFLQSGGELDIHVGLSDAHPSMGELSLIGVSVALPGGQSAKVAVLGPMRMNYLRVMSAVYHVGHALRGASA